MWQRSFVARMLLTGLLLLLALLSHAVCHKHSMRCSVCNDPFPIAHEFHQEAHLVIGGFAPIVFFFYDTPSFVERPAQTLIDEPM